MDVSRIFRRAAWFAAIAALFAPLPASTASVSWTDGTGFWDVATNWSSNPLLPGVADDVTVSVAGLNTITYRTATTTINSLNFSGTNTLVITGGALTVTNAYSNASLTNISGGSLTLNGASTLDSLTLSNGTLSGTGSVTVSGLTTWTTGTMTGTGTTNANGGIAISGNNVHDLRDGRVLSLAGTSTWSGNTGNGGGSIRMGGGPGATINNAGLWQDQNGFDSSISNTFGGTNTFNNTGTYTKSGAGTTTISIAFNNTSSGAGTGVVNVTGGSLILSGGGTANSGSTFTGLAGTTLGIGGGYTTQLGSSIATAGTGDFVGGTNSVAGSYSAGQGTTFSGGTTTFSNTSTVTGVGPTLAASGGTGIFNNGQAIATTAMTLSSGGLTFSNTGGASTTTLSLTGGTLGGTSTVTVSGSTTWTTGTMTGTGTTDAGGGIAISGNGVHDLTAGRVLNLAGSTWSGNTGNGGGSIRLGGGPGATINNAGLWQDQNGFSSNISNTFGGTSTFNNTGTYTKSGAGTTTISVAFNNTSSGAGTGVVNVTGGNLILSGGGTANSGSSLVGAAGTTLEFGGGTYDLLAGSTVNAPDVTFSGGTTNVAGSYTASGTTRVNGGTVNFTGSVANVGGTLLASSGTANFNNAAGVTFSSINLSGGTIGGTQSVTSTGLLTWTSGTMTGAGTTNASGGIAISGNGVHDLRDGRVLNLAGTSTWSGNTSNGGGSIRLGGSGGATINNPGLWQDQNGFDSNISNTFGGTSTFNNTGTYTKSGAGTTTISVAFNNTSSGAGTGVVNVTGGSLILSGGGTANSGSSFVGAAGTTLEFGGGTYDLLAGSTVNAPDVTFSGGTTNVAGSYTASGTTRVNGGTVNFTGSVANVGGTLLASSGTANFNNAAGVTFSSINLSGGTIGGTQSVTSTGLLTWTSGTMIEAGTTNASGGIAISGNNVHDLRNGRVLNLAGTSTWSNTGNGGGSIRLGGALGATINNAGLWQDQNGFDSSISNTFGGTNTFNNTGTYAKSGAGTTTISVAFNNTSSGAGTGVVNVTGGSLILSGGGTANSGSSFVGAAGTTLEFGGGTYDLLAGSTVNAPDVTFSGGTTNVAGSYTASGTTRVNGGTVNFTGSVANVGGTLLASSGTANFNNAAGVTFSSINLSGGTIGGTQSVTSTGLLTWTSGTMTGAGTTNASGGIAISGNNVHDLRDGRVLNLAGTSTWSGNTSNGGGSIRLGGAAGATINNAGLWQDQNGFGSSISNTFGGTNTFNNTGTYTKSGAGTTTISVAFNNTSSGAGTGVVNVNAGILALSSGGTSNGTFNIASGTTLDFSDGTYSLNNASSAASAGRLLVSGATVNTTGAFSHGALTEVTGGTLSAAAALDTVTYTQSGGTLSGTGPMNVSGLLTWTGGTMTGAGTTNANGGIAISGNGVHDLTAGRVLNLAGTSTWSGNTSNGGGSIRLGGAAGATINNAGLWQDQNGFNSNISNTFGGTNTFNNTGTYTKSGDATTAISIAFTNSGTVNANAGVLNVSTGIQGASGTVNIGTAGALVLGAASTVGTLNHSGAAAASLSIGTNNVTVSGDYNNANFGTGNAFNRYANVTRTTGAILAGGDANQAVIAGTGTVVGGGATAAPTLTIGNVRVGATTFTYNIANTGTTGPSIRGAVQTSGGGANITDGRLSGSGVSQSSFGPIGLGGSQSRDVTITIGTAGVYAPISAQAVGIVNNFQNLNQQLLTIQSSAGAAAYNLAAGSASPSPINLGNFRVGQPGGAAPQSQNVAVTNTVAGPFTEGLGIGSAGVNNAAFTLTNNLGSTLIAAGGSNATALNVARSGGGAGLNTGTLAIQYTSDGAGTSGLAAINANSQNVTVNATGFNMAAGSASPSPINLGNFRVGQPGGAAPQSQNVAVTNTVAGPFTEGLGIGSAGVNNAAFTLTNNLGSTLIAAGGNNATALNVARSGGGAGLNTGTLAIQYTSDGAGTSGLAAINANSQNVTVNATGFNMAAGSASPSPINLGNFRVGQPGGAAPQSQNVAVTNTVAGPFTEGLGIGSAGVNNAAFTLTNNLGSTLIAAGGNNATALNVARSGGGAGLNTGTLAIQYTSDGAGTSGLAAINANSQNVTVNATGFNMAAGSASPSPINLGNFRVGLPGGVAPQSQNVAVTNTVAGPFTEGLGIGSAGVNNAAFTLTNNLGSTLIAAGGSNATALNVARSGGGAGLNTGTLAIQYTSDGAGTSGLAAINANSQNVTVNATGFNMAAGSASPSPINLGNFRVGQPGGVAPQSQNVAVTNTVADPFTEGLGIGSAGVNNAAFTLTNNLGSTLIAAGGSNATALNVARSGGVAGVNSGTLAIQYTSDGAGTSGLAAINANSQNITVNAAGYVAASGVINTAPLNFGTVQVGQAVSQVLSIANNAVGAAGFVEDLNASFGASSGTGSALISGSGGISGLLAGATNNTGMTVSVNTSAAGTVNGAIAVNFVSAGAVAGVSNGLGTLAVGSTDYGVQGLIQANVINTASPVINNSPINLGNVRIGAVSPTAFVSVTNQTTTAPQAALNASISGNPPITASGSFNLLAPGATNSNSLQVGMNTGAAGAINDSATIAFVSDASNVGGCAPNCQLNLPSQNVTVTGGVYQMAQPDLPANVNLGNFRLGSAASQAIAIANTNISPAGFQEGLDASVGGTGGKATATGGPIVNLAQGGNSTAISVGINNATAAAGINTGTVTINLASNGSTTSGLATLDLASAVVNVSGTGFNMAAGSASPSPINLGNFRVGQAGGVAPQSQNVAVTNTVADPFTEGLGIGSAGVNNAAFTLTNNLGSTLIAAGGSNATALNVARSGGVAGVNSGTLAIQYTSDGAGTSGLAAINANSQNITVNAAGYVAASGVINTAPLNFGTVQVGQAVSQVLSIANNAVGAAGFVEDLNASFGASSGTGSALISGSGGISGLLAGATNNTGMTVSVNTSAAGTVNGAIAVNFVSAGAVAGVSNGLGTLAVGSTDYGVQGLIQANVINTASPVINNSPINLGNVRIGAVSPTAFVSVTNQTTTAPQAALNASISGNPPITASGSFNLLAPGATNSNSLQVGMNTGAAGAINDSATIAFVSDASNVGGCAPNCQLNLPSQNVTVTGGVYQMAQPDLPANVNLGNFRLGSAASQAIAIANTNISPAGFQEGLDASVGGTGGKATATGGPIVNLAQGGNSTAISVGISNATAAAGINTGTVTINLASNGSTTSGLATLDLAPAVVNVSGTGYRLANPVLNTTSVTLAARVGDASPGSTVSVTNSSPDQFTEGLKAAIGTASPGFTASGAIANLGAQGTDTSTLRVSLITGVAGSFGGSAALTLASTGAGTTGAPDLALPGQNVNLSGKVYTPAVAQVASSSVNFGIVHVGDSVAQAISVTNAAGVTALNDVLRGSFNGASAPFTGSGTLGSGVAAGDTDSTSLRVGLNTAVAGSYTGSATFGMTSHDNDLADLPLGDLMIGLSGTVNNYAKSVFTFGSGAGVFSGSGNNFVLDFGARLLGSGMLTSTLFASNGAVGPADLLDGNYAFLDPSDFSKIGFDPFLDLAAGGITGQLLLQFNANSLGDFSDTIRLSGIGHNASGYSADVDPITLTIHGRVVAAGNVPEPGTLLLMVVALLALGYGTARRSHRALGRGI